MAEPCSYHGTIIDSKGKGLETHYVIQLDPTYES